MARRPVSLALRLTLSIGTVISLVLLGFGWLVERSIDTHFVQQDVDELNAIVQAVTQVLAESPLPPTDDALKRRLAGAVAGHHNAQFWLADARGVLLYATPDSMLAEFAQRTPSRAPFSVLAGHSQTAIDVDTVTLWQQQERTYRASLVPLLPIAAQGHLLQDAPFRLAVATDIGFHLHYLDDFRAFLNWLTAVACLIAIVATWLAVYQGHAPLRRISGNIRRIESDQLSIRLDPSTVPVELTELALSFNDLLERIEEGFQRLTHFSTDIAHELRTPITNLRTQTEVALSQSREIEQYREVLYSSLEEYERMAKMVGDMLFLAQADNQQLLGERVRINLATEVQMLCEYFEILAEERAVTLQNEGPSLWVLGDRLMIRRALSNLLSNAIRYTPVGQAVTISWRAQGSAWVLIAVENPSDVLPPEPLSRVFDRFYRADPSRQHTGDGAGLGLAIVKSIIEAHGGRIRAHSLGKRIMFEIQLVRCTEE